VIVRSPVLTSPGADMTEGIRLADLLAQTRQQCVEAIASASLAESARRLGQAGVARADWIDVVRGFWRTARYPDAVSAAIEAAPPTTVVRRLLLEAALAALDRLPGERLAPAVKALLCEEYGFIAQPGAGLSEWFDPAQYPLRVLSGFALLERLPAGQLSFETSGMPRSWFLSMRPRDLPRFVRHFVLEERRFHPYYFVHVGIRRNKLPILLEAESNRSYYRMAGTMELHPEIRGILACSWLYHRDNHIGVNPHLLWITDVMEANGALTTRLGPADPGTGFLAGNSKRRELYESGQWKPVDGLVVWPRAHVLRWAAQHPELADPVS
jgi:hypothetical protein